MKLPQHNEDTHFEAFQTFPKLDRICLGAEWVILGKNPALIISHSGMEHENIEICYVFLLVAEKADFKIAHTKLTRCT